MNLDALMAIFSEFDVAAFLPQLDTLLGWVEMILRILVMAGPLMMLGFGLLYLQAPPKGAMPCLRAGADGRCLHRHQHRCDEGL